MRKIILAAFVAAVSTGSARAATFNFLYSDGASTFASGSLTTSDTKNANGSFDITSIAGTGNGQAITGLFTGQGTGFTYDNYLFITAADPLAGSRGPAFSTALTTYNVFEAQLSGFGGTAANPDALFNSATGVIQYGRFSLTSAASAVPEPTTWAMMLIGFGMVAGAARYRRRNVKVLFG